MPIDPNVELAFWRELAWDTWQRGQQHLAQEIWGAALNEYAALTAASTDHPAAQQAPWRPPDEREEAVTRDAVRNRAGKPAGGKLRGARP